MPYADPDRQRQFNREWIARRRAEWFANKACYRCGTTRNLRLDHRDPDTKVSHKVWSWSQERRDVELAKCQVLCHDCHVWKTLGCEEHAHGEQMGNAKLTDDMVREIRTRVGRGATKRGLAREYGVSEKLIRLVAKDAIWKHVEHIWSGPNE